MTPAHRTSGVAVPLLVLAIVLVLAGAGGLWYLFFRPSGPPPVVSTASPGPSVAISPPGSGAETVGGGSLAGTWNVDPSIGKFADFSGTFVGYRVQEQLANIGANTAVGRTADVTGSLTLQGSTVTAANFTAKLTNLTSDERARDGRVRESLNVTQFPNATFVLGSPIQLASLPAEGQEMSVTGSAKLTIRGVTRDVQFPLTAKLSGSTLTVKGALEIRFADFGIPKPTAFTVLSIADTGTIEVQLQMRRG